MLRSTKRNETKQPHLRYYCTHQDSDIGTALMDWPKPDFPTLCIDEKRMTDTIYILEHKKGVRDGHKTFVVLVVSQHMWSPRGSRRAFYGTKTYQPLTFCLSFILSSLFFARSMMNPNYPIDKSIEWINHPSKPWLLEPSRDRCEDSIVFFSSIAIVLPIEIPDQELTSLSVGFTSHHITHTHTHTREMNTTRMAEDECSINSNCFTDRDSRPRVDFLERWIHITHTNTHTHTNKGNEYNTDGRGRMQHNEWIYSTRSKQWLIIVTIRNISSDIFIHRSILEEVKHKGGNDPNKSRLTVKYRYVSCRTQLLPGTTEWYVRSNIYRQLIVI